MGHPRLPCASFEGISKPVRTLVRFNNEGAISRTFNIKRRGGREVVLRISIFQATPVSASPLINYSLRGVVGWEGEIS